MQEFMEVYTAIYLTWGFIVPCCIIFMMLFMFTLGQMLALNYNNFMTGIFLFVFMILATAKTFSTFDKAPYIQVRMEQFEGSDDKLDVFEE